MDSSPTTSTTIIKQKVYLYFVYLFFITLLLIFCLTTTNIILIIYTVQLNTDCKWLNFKPSLNLLKYKTNTSTFIYKQTIKWTISIHPKTVQTETSKAHQFNEIISTWHYCSASVTELSHVSNIPKVINSVLHQAHRCKYGFLTSPLGTSVNFVLNSPNFLCVLLTSVANFETMISNCLAVQQWLLTMLKVHYSSVFTLWVPRTRAHFALLNI